MQKLMLAYRVDNVPLVLKPIYYFYSAIGGLFWILFFITLRVTCRIQLQGDPPKNTSSYIFAFWHESVWAVIVCLSPFRNHWWINHPYWYMKPVHIVVNLLGAKLVLGSTGAGGREAANTVVEKLKGGARTCLQPDGPGGPANVLKKGVLHMAMQSGVPIIPLHVSVSRCWRDPGWDRKIYPLPFSTISISFGEKIFVTEENFQQVMASASSWLPVAKTS